MKTTEICLALWLACAPWAARAAEKPFLHPLFGDNAVLQRDVAAPVWGWTTPGARVAVSIAGQSAQAVARADGRWECKLGPLLAGGPHTMTVDGPEKVTLTQVMVGDIWICSGQSNMEMGVGAINAPRDVAAANYPGIRLFMVNNRTSPEPLEVVESKWQVCSPQSIVQGGWGGFSAVGYFFGRQLHEQLKVPIGLIDSNWGGTIAEAWVSAPGLKPLPEFAEAVKQVEAAARDAKDGGAASDRAMAAWYVKNDPGSAQGLGWADPQVTFDGKLMDLPHVWEEAGLPGFDGIVWFRREIELPAAWEGRAATLSLGPIDDRDVTWVNGQRVGAGDDWSVPRSYKVPAGVLKPGKNTIAIRVLDTGGGGGVYGQPDQMKLVAADLAPVSLAGSWQFRASKPLAQCTPVPVNAGGNPNIVTVLYNAMIAPLAPMALRGAVWYQGESNCGRGAQYRRLLPALVRDWRATFGANVPGGPDALGFYVVQLANFMAVRPKPTESAWAELREAQAYTARTVPNTGLAVAIDIGDAADIHPRNKQEVGRRLALAALATTYGQKVEFAGPTYRAMKVEGNSVRLTFDHVGGGLKARGDKLQGFALKGENGEWVWAEAVIDGASVVVASALVKKPVAVRYAWADNPVCNLYNAAGLPAVPFRTDAPEGVSP